MKVFLRIGKKKRGYKVEASEKPDYNPLKQSSVSIPTVSFAVDIDLPDSAFSQNERSIGRIVIPETSLRDISINLNIENADV